MDELTLTGFENPDFQPKKSSPPPIEADDIVQQKIGVNNFPKTTCFNDGLPERFIDGLGR